MTQTTLFTVLCIAIRIGGLVLAGRALLEIPALLLTDYSHWSSAWLFFGVAFAFGIVLAGFLLWLFPSGPARLAAGKASHEPLSSSIDARDLQYVGFSLLGVWIIVEGITGLLYETRIVWLLADSTGDARFGWPDTGILIATNAALVLMGAMLLFGARGLSALLHRLRHGNAVTATDRPDESFRSQ